MEAVYDLDDALLVREDVLGAPYISEAAAKIASEALPNEELRLTDEGMVRFARVIGAIDRKPTSMRRARGRTIQRLR